MRPETISADNSISGEENTQIQEFLEKFFSLYAYADEKELVYYVKNDALGLIDDS